MNDGIVKGTGNSRWMKTVQDALTKYPTYEAFMQALVEGTFSFDLNGMKPEGWEQIGTTLDTANVLTDETAESMGLPDTATPNDAFAMLRKLITSAQESADAAQSTADSKAKFVVSYYLGTGTFGPSNKNRISFSFTPKIVLLYGGYYAANFHAQTSGATPGEAALWVPLVWNETKQFKFSRDYSSYWNMVSYTSNAVEWYYDTTATGGAYERQLNVNNQKYYYMAFA